MISKHILFLVFGNLKKKKKHLSFGKKGNDKGKQNKNKNKTKQKRQTNKQNKTKNKTKQNKKRQQTNKTKQKTKQNKLKKLVMHFIKFLFTHVFLYDFAMSKRSHHVLTYLQWLPHAFFFILCILAVIRYSVQLTLIIKFWDIVTILQSCVFSNKRKIWNNKKCMIIIQIYLRQRLRSDTNWVKSW